MNDLKKFDTELAIKIGQIKHRTLIIWGKNDEVISALFFLKIFRFFINLHVTNTATSFQRCRATVTDHRELRVKNTRKMQSCNAH